MGLLDEIIERLEAMPPEQLEELRKARARYKQVWFPTPGPQQQGYESPADELFYGGSAGGG